MAKAMKCDRCEELYEIPKEDGMEYNITKDGDSIDMCPACKFDLEEFMQDKVHRKKKSVNPERKQWSEESRARASERMKKVAEKAKEIRSSTQGLSHSESMGKASQALATTKNLFSDIPKAKNGEKHYKVQHQSLNGDDEPSYKCAMCMEKPVEQKGMMCRECDSHFGHRR